MPRATPPPFERGDRVQRRRATSVRGTVVAVRDDGETVVVRWDRGWGVAGTKTIEQPDNLVRLLTGDEV